MKMIMLLLIHKKSISNFSPVLPCHALLPLLYSSNRSLLSSVKLQSKKGKIHTLNQYKNVKSLPPSLPPYPLSQSITAAWAASPWPPPPRAPPRCRACIPRGGRAEGRATEVELQLLELAGAGCGEEAALDLHVREGNRAHADLLPPAVEREADRALVQVQQAAHHVPHLPTGAPFSPAVIVAGVAKFCQAQE